MVSFCGVNYHKCKLQLSGGVHCSQAGREYTGLSVAFSIIKALFDFGSEHPPLPTPAGPSSSSETGSVTDPLELHDTSADAGGCGAPPVPLNDSKATGIPNVLLIGDSISMGFGYPNGEHPRCACGAPKCCVPDYRLGYGLYVQEMLRNTTDGWNLMEVQHNGGWYLDGQAGDTKLGVSCLDHWLGISKSPAITPAKPPATTLDDGSNAEPRAGAGAFQWDIVHVIILSLFTRSFRYVLVVLGPLLSFGHSCSFLLGERALFHARFCSTSFVAARSCSLSAGELRAARSEQPRERGLRGDLRDQPQEHR